MSTLRLENAGFTYQKGMPDEKTAVSGVTLSFDEGDFVGIIGHTGSGKSTLIQMLNGLLKPTTGNVYIDGDDIWDDRSKLREKRFKVGLVLQYPEYQLFEETVRKDIAFGPRNLGLSEEEIDSRVKEAAEFLRIPDKLLDRSPFDLSGGEKRRAAIAGVLAMRPEVLVLDEPTAGLDPRGRRDILDVIRNYHEAEKKTVILVSHSMDDVARYANKVLVMNNGTVLYYDTVAEVFKHALELRETGLNIPTVTGILLTLKERGLDVDTDIYTPAAAAQTITETFRGTKR
ncbi:MAG: energy-coupling factor transporter ATPase [Oscillospiraceae bacterium]|nr:energy-coupling factor transporter ATPase [Oscillospiraceae bacterium]MBR4928838.1 energy-coupling factor transporter ATPase [Oscillospiraceae bacterium]MBR5045963.1 energy-coupling factor transporter ATPase [Oscillospiraceae bacterium]MBR5071112.1 energy-coupling factor transporter ATPase [Oscillospiraceae bacterium]MBR5980157.1 energy-coupling factor transporter ATPase [Oscillospiraceae bacterium]